MNTSSRIAVFFRRKADGELMAEFLRTLGFTGVLPLKDLERQVLGDIGLMVIGDEVAQIHGEALLSWKRGAAAGFRFIPIIVAAPQGANPARWLSLGFDDVISIPTSKDLLAIRIRTWLRVAEETTGRFRELVKASTIGFYRTTPDGRVIYANPALVRLLGLSSFAELAERDLSREGFAPETPRSEFLELVERDGEVSNYQAVWLTKDGEKVFVVESARAVRDENGRTLYYEGTVQDITLLRRHEERFSAIEKLGRNLVMARTPQEVGQAVVGAACQILGLEGCQILMFMIDRTGQNLVLIADLLGLGSASPPPPVVEVAKTGKSIPNSSATSAHGDGLHLPLRVGDRTIGVLSIRGSAVARFSSEERELAETLADVAAIALENARLFAEAREAQENLARQVERLLILHETSQKSVVAGWDMEAVVEAVYEGVAKLMPAEAFVLAVRTGEDEAEGVFLMDEGGRYPPRKIPKGESLTWQVLSSGKSLYIPDTEEGLPFKPPHFGTEKSVRSLLAVPLKVGEKTVGMLSVQSYRPQAYAPEDRLLLEMLAPYVAAALENARLVRELRESLERYRRLTENAQDLIYKYRLHPTPGFEYVNPAASKITGYSPEEHYADPELGLKIIHPEDRPVLQRLREGSSFFYTPIQLRWRRKDGGTVWTEQINIPVYDEEGRLVAIEGIARDITDRKRAEEALARLAAERAKLLEQVVAAFSSAMGLKEPYTAKHQERVALLACAIAEELGLSREKVEGLRVAALLHDIGKILAVPNEILSKPGKLTEHEMALIRTHPQVGYEILKNVDFPWPVAEIVWQHHERLDGSGYPRGLQGPDIILEARILAVADVVEAISSHRPYRPALGVDKALEEIQNADKYDQEVARACIEIFRRGFSFG